MPALIEVGELASAAQGVVVVDVRWTLGGPSGLPEFEEGHIPGAQWVDLEHALSDPPGMAGRHPLPDPDRFAAALRRIGVSGDRPVVIYDGANSLAAARLWWLLTDAGHDQVRVLDGGFAAWRAAGLPIATGPAEPVGAGDFVARPGQRGRVSAGEIIEMISRGDHPPIVDVRAADRYRGENETIDPIAGHIPGAINLPASELLTADGHFLPAATLRDRFIEQGLDDHPVLYCGSGITAAQALLALESAGLTSGRIYPGSWSEWISDPGRPVARCDED